MWVISWVINEVENCTSDMGL
ncbi:hypothetical protein C5167_009421 [Papaver somniferum]|uniref:Uncharacterized protein n=1 Tax=Papaver somniferum TaxID=3469 RepID=A0A4Y7JYS0_PAPSO|nr:hypothetical protein C5167_009421 [Papaver somniferum]